jgi:hypothetical protein
MGSRYIAATILNLCTRWRLVVGFTTMPVYLWENNPLISSLGPRAGLYFTEKRKVSRPYRKSNDSSVIKP